MKHASVRRLGSALALFSLACPAGASAAELASAPWEIGPVIRGRNYSQGMPAQPDPTPAGGWAFEFPQSGSVHYVTLDTGPLSGARRIVVRYRIEAVRGAQFVAAQAPGSPATVSLYLQRAGDTWSGKREYEFFRWYAPAASIREIRPGVGEISVSLDDHWTSVQGRPASAAPGAFEDALRNTQRIGLVFGTSAARGHGVHATAPARFELESFRVE